MEAINAIIEIIIGVQNISLEKCLSANWSLVSLVRKSIRLSSAITAVIPGDKEV